MSFDGFIIVDKPINKLSHEVTSLIGRLFNTKAGHAGTLDPNVSGVLPIALGKSRKLLRFVSFQKKTYVGIVKFPHEVSMNYITSLFSKFKGKIIQTPPKMSAVAKKPRVRHVYELKPLEIYKNRVLFLAEVEKGTYIRTLCKDMGGEMEDLRRIKVGPIDESKAIHLLKIRIAVECYKKGKPTLLNSILIPPERFMKMLLPSIYLNKKAALAVSNGAQLMRPGIIKYGEFKEGDFISYFYRNIFIGVGKAELSSSQLKDVQKGLVARTERIHRAKNELVKLL